MNILFIVNELRYTCGVTNHIIHLSKGLAETGKVNLWIITGGGTGTDRFKDIPVNIINDKRFLHANRNIANYLSAINFLRGFIKKNKIDVVHSHTHYGANIAVNASKLASVKTVQTNHGILQENGKLKHFNAGKYIVINEHIYNYILGNKISPRENITLIRCGIPVDETPPAKEDSPIKVIAASRFTSEKGLDTYIEALSKLNPDTKNKAEFYLAGEGETEAELVKLNTTTNAGVKFLGSVKDIYDLLRKTHVLVYPSRSKSEGFPAIITEAGATNNLVISSDFDGVEYVINGNEDGFIFKQNDVDALHDKLRNAINNYADYKSKSLKFYNKIKDWFNIDTMIDKHMELYEECLRK